MNFENVRTPSTRHTGAASGAAAAVRRPVELSMYRELPTGEISLEEFEQYALDRLRGILEWYL